MSIDTEVGGAPTLPADDAISSEGFWRNLNPELHIGQGPANATSTPQQSLERLTKRIIKEGYFGEHDDALLNAAPVLADAVKSCVRLGLPPVFIWIYDEPWASFRRLSPALSHLLGDQYKLLPDFWAWHVDPTRAETGWTPHRDKANRPSLARDFSPLSVTCWIPLDDANPLNSCMYIVPAHLDPNYNKPGQKDNAPISLNTVRALPARPGDYLIWNQAVLHWGSMSSEFADAPRMSMALEFQRGDIPAYNEPLLDPSINPPFAERLRLIGKQILQYRHMYGFSDRLTALATKLFESGGASGLS